MITSFIHTIEIAPKDPGPPLPVFDPQGPDDQHAEFIHTFIDWLTDGSAYQAIWHNHVVIPEFAQAVIRIEKLWAEALTEICHRHDLPPPLVQHKITGNSLIFRIDVLDTRTAEVLRKREPTLCELLSDWS